MTDPIEWCGLGPEVEMDPDVSGWSGDRFVCHELRDSPTGDKHREKFKWGESGYLSVKTQEGRLKIDHDTEVDWEIDGTTVTVRGPDVEWQVG